MPWPIRKSGWMGTPEQRFWKKVKIADNGCWEWIGSKGTLKGKEYGVFIISSTHATKKTVRAHRWAYETYIGKIPEGLELDHQVQYEGSSYEKHFR